MATSSRGAQPKGREKMEKQRFELIDRDSCMTIGYYGNRNEAAAEACKLIRSGDHESIDLVDREKNSAKNFRKAA